MLEPTTTIRIYYTEGSDPMVTDTVTGLNNLANHISEFVASPRVDLVLPAVTTLNPAPYEALLPSIRFTKSEDSIMVSIDPRVGLSVVGAPEKLALWCSHFHFPAQATEGDHHHPEHVHKSGYISPSSLSVIIEVQDDH
jgi:hypothetical protein